MKLKVKIILMFVLTTVVSIGSIASFSIYNISNETKQSINENMSSTVGSYVNSFDGWIRSNAKLIETTNSLIGRTTNGSDINVSYLQAFKDPDNIKNVMSIYMSLSNGKYFDGSGWIPDKTYNAHKRDWYIGAKAAGKEYITDAYIDAETKKYCVSIALPLYGKNHRFLGVTSEDIFVSTITDEVSKIRYNGSGYSFLVDKNGTLISYPDQKMIGKNINDYSGLKPIYSRLSASGSGELEYNYNGKTLMMVYEKVPSTGWTLCLNVDKSLAYAPIQNLMLKYIGIAVVLLILVIALAVLLSLSLTKPIAAIAAMFQHAEQGDFTITAPEKSKKRRDEIGMLERAFDGMILHIQAAADHAQKIARGDLDFTISEKSDKDVLAISMKQVVKTLNSLAENMNSMSANAVEGNLDARGQADRFEGEYRKIVEGMNSTLDAVSKPIEEVRNVVYAISLNDYTVRPQGNYEGIFKDLGDDVNMVREKLLVIQNDMIRISKGDISSLEETRKTGKLSENDNMTPALIAMMQNIEALIEEVGRISGESVNGRVIESRGNADGFEGGFKQIIEGFNETLDSIAGPLLEIMNMLNAMAVNDFTSEISSSYKGDYQKLAEAVRSVTRNLLSVQNVAVKISDGDVSELEHFRQIGRRSANDKLLPAFIQMMETIAALIAETTEIANSAADGNLALRGNPENFKGGYAQIVNAVNGFLDAVERPVNEFTGLMVELCDTGKLDLSITGSYKGEFLRLSNATNHTIHLIRQIVGNVALKLNEMSKGNFSMERMNDYPGDYQILTVSINTILDSLNELLSHIDATSEQVAAGSLQVSQGSQSLSQGATEQASAVEELTATITQIAAQTRQNAMDAGEASRLAENVKLSADSGNGDMRDMLNAISDIGAASSNISRIIKVIDDIAFQTNILALNAAVEAARAGQYGKGFAVVAEEVRNLAAKSADAAKETTGLIESTIGKVHSGTEIANKTAGALSDIVNGVDRVTAFVRDISTASNQQATGIAQVDTGLKQVSQVIQTISATSEQSAAASEELQGQADLLRQQVAKFQLRKQA
jgi:Methyl-accepting chemotaxis protein